MANQVRTKIERVSGKYSAKVAEIRKLEADKRKPFVTDAETKSINTQIKKLDAERLTISKELNKLGKLAKTAEEYLDLNKKIKEIEARITKANARGEDTVESTRQKNIALGRLKEISPEVESNFPEIKVAKPATTTSVPREQLKGDRGLLAQESAAKGTVTSTGTPPVAGTPAVNKGTIGTPPPKKDGKVPAPEKVETTTDREAAALESAATTADLTLSATLFKNIPSLKLLLEEYVKTPGMTEAAFLKKVRDDIWFKQNSKEIKNRYVQYYNYRDLQASGQAQGTTAYEMEIAKIEASLKKRAVELGSAAASDPAALRKAAENLYITNRSDDESFITDFLAASIKPLAGMIGGKRTEGYSGEALTNYDKLVEAARDNGFQVSDILPGAQTEQQVIQGIISGKIDVNRVIADARKLASQGQPQYVRDLLSQGYNLKQVFAPYRQVMANVLEIGDANQIDLNDPLLRSAITDKGDMNLYDFRKALRQDNRWQYTAQAKEDVSTAALQVLRDFGFQG